MTALTIQTFNSPEATSVLSQQMLGKIYSEEELHFKQKDTYNTDFLCAIIFVMENNSPVGRLAIYNNNLLQLEGKPAICVGNFECIHQIAVASLLIDEATEIAKKLNAAFLIGPMNGSTWDNYRFPVGDIGNPFFTEEISRLYYPEFFTELGFSVLSQYYSTEISDMDNILNSLNEARTSYFLAAGIQVRTIDLNNFENDLTIIYDFSMRVFAKNFLFTPITRASFINKYLSIKQYIIPDFCLIAFNKEGELVSFFFSLPDLYNTREKILVVKTIAGLQGRQYAGLPMWLLHKLVEKAVPEGYTGLINAFMHKSNISRNLSEKFKGNIMRTYHLYSKEIANH